jgi:hypothetical protein
LGLEKPNSGLDHGETFFPDSGSDLDSDETFQISRNVGLDIDEIVCLLDSQLWLGHIPHQGGGGARGAVGLDPQRRGGPY